jgi:predicted permease
MDRVALSALLACLIYAYLFVCAFFLPRLLKIPEKDRGTYQVMTIFANIGFMGLPVILAVYGKEAVLYATVFLFPYNVLIYTLGIRLLVQGEEKEKTRIRAKDIFNIGFVSALAALVVYLSGIPVPSPITGVLGYLSGLSAPLSMILIGYSLTRYSLRTLFTDARLVLFSLIRLLAVPLLGMLVIRLFIHDSDLLGVCLIMLATPVGSMTSMLAELYGGDMSLASRGVALTTALCVATIPFLSLVLGI